MLVCGRVLSFYRLFVVLYLEEALGDRLEAVHVGTVQVDAPERKTNED